jgi:hypothetical protein
MPVKILQINFKYSVPTADLKSAVDTLSDL